MQTYRLGEVSHRVTAAVKDQDERGRFFVRMLTGKYPRAALNTVDIEFQSVVGGSRYWQADNCRKYSEKNCWLL